MRRREFITLIGGATAWPLAARAQQPPMPVIGYLDSGSPEASVQLAAVLKGLNEAGYIEGRNVEIDYQWARGQYERLATLAAHFLERHVALIVTRGFPSTVAAKSATSTVPIVFITGGDPVDFGLVTSLNRPGGNVTGVNLALGALGPKRLELLRELVPTAVTVAILVNPNNPISDTHLARRRRGRVGLAVPQPSIRCDCRLVRHECASVDPDWSECHRCKRLQRQLEAQLVRHFAHARWPDR
jgi:putative tryptophan/tyrosine transport system substrate-binding protein